MEKKKEFIINTLYLATIFAIIYLVINYLLPVVFPFILGFVFAYCARIISTKVFKSSKNSYRCLSLVLIYVLLITVCIILVAIGVGQLTTFISNLPSVYNSTISPYLLEFEDVLMHFNESLPEWISASLSSSITSLFTAFNTAFSKIAGVLVNITTGVIKNTPNVIISVIVTLVSSFYILLDYENIASWFVSALPKGVTDVLFDVKVFCEDVLFKIVGCYALIMLMTFAELCIGLMLFGIPNAVLWSMLIAVLDILPILGVGTALIPWSIISLAVGDYLLGIGIAAIYLVITVVRNIVEPKLVGGNLGLHPLATLIFMIVGADLFGILGLFGLPLAMSFIHNRSKNSR